MPAFGFLFAKRISYLGHKDYSIKSTEQFIQLRSDSGYNHSLP